MSNNETQTDLTNTTQTENAELEPEPEPEGLLEFQLENTQVVMAMGPLAGLEDMGELATLWENAVNDHMVEYYETGVGKDSGYYGFKVYTETMFINPNVDLDHFAVEYAQYFTIRAVSNPSVMKILKAPFENEDDKTKFMARLGEAFELNSVTFVGSTDEYAAFYGPLLTSTSNGSSLELMLMIIVPVSLILVAAVCCFFLRRGENCSINCFSRGKAKSYNSPKMNTISGKARNRSLDLDLDVLDIHSEIDKSQTKHQQYLGYGGHNYGQQGSQPQGYRGGYPYPQ